MRINVLVVEDDPITAQDISETLEDFGMRITHSVSTGEKALEVVKSDKPDVILMDINLEGSLDGVGTVVELNKTESIPVIYLTANSDKLTASRAFQTNPYAFITKPFNENDISFAVELAFNNHLQKIFETSASKFNNKLESLFIKSGERYEKIVLKDILYIRADGSYSHIFTSNKEYPSSNNLNFIWNKLTHPMFVRIHRSYVVNVENITSFDNSHVYFGEQYVPYSKNHKEELMEKINRIS